ncbi:serine/threonine protein kinase [Caldanaerobius fijiensis DSM 17918]|uniref:Serine/threonine protein kinase n=1 Tax=Caldanaerobius fijiensis DSM 17918 TaxID=1121256 RepID=A0A1M4Z1Z7_9THEO|nr:protein kinase [Caldanaerobius fijiensis]SHF12081.1 serine/threonine protein kinase [Caldanaerobius fijiensis DSM 17918]
MRIREGDIIKGRWSKKSYEVIKKLGEGGLGIVFLTKCMDDGQKYAVKVFDNVMNAAREYRLLKEFSHLQYIPYVYGLDDMLSGQAGFIVMEYIHGDNLQSFLKCYKLSVKNVIGISVVLLKLLGEFHKKGYAYADLKPENIMIDKNKKLLRIVDIGGLMKFGMGVKEYTPRFDRASWGYGLRKADRAYDLFGLGILLLELLSGRRCNPDRCELKDLLRNIKFTSPVVYNIVEMCFKGEDVNRVFDYAYSNYKKENMAAAKIDKFLNIFLTVGLVFLFLFVLIWYNTIL